MRINRTCPKCLRQEGIIYNFGNNKAAMVAFNKKKWCKCGYNTPQEMMEDNDLGFTDETWLLIAKNFIGHYHRSYNYGFIHNSEELIRFFLKALKTTAENFSKDIVLVENNGGRKFDTINNGKPEKKPRLNVLKDAHIEFYGIEFNNKNEPPQHFFFNLSNPTEPENDDDYQPF